MLTLPPRAPLRVISSATTRTARFEYLPTHPASREGFLSKLDPVPKLYSAFSSAGGSSPGAVSPPHHKPSKVTTFERGTNPQTAHAAKCWWAATTQTLHHSDIFTSCRTKTSALNWLRPLSSPLNASCPLSR